MLFAGFWRECRGVAMIEFALVTPLIVAMLLPLVDVGMGFYRKTQLMTAAEAGAQYAWLQGFNSATIKTIVQNATGLGSASLPVADITVTLSCKCVDKTTSLFTATSPAITPASATDCTGTTSCSYSANNYSTSPGAYVTVTIAPATACSASSTDAVCYRPLFTYWILGGPVSLTVTSTGRVS
jgi:Flp pilus assembly protein TadG